MPDDNLTSIELHDAREEEPEEHAEDKILRVAHSLHCMREHTIWSAFTTLYATIPLLCTLESGAAILAELSVILVGFSTRCRATLKELHDACVNDPDDMGDAFDWLLESGGLEEWLQEKIEELYRKMKKHFVTRCDIHESADGSAGED